jgi:hypothetical protein
MPGAPIALRRYVKAYYPSVVVSVLKAINATYPGVAAYIHTLSPMRLKNKIFLDHLRAKAIVFFYR